MLEKKLNEQTSYKIQEVLSPITVAWQQLSFTEDSITYMSEITVSLDYIQKSLINFDKTKFNYIFEKLEYLINLSPSGSEFVIMESVLKDVIEDISNIQFNHFQELNRITIAKENTMEEIIDMHINSLKMHNEQNLDPDEVMDAQEIYANLETIKTLEYLKIMARIKEQLK